MSYDILLIPLPADADPEEFVSEREEEEEPFSEPSPEAEGRKRALAESLVRARNALEEFQFDHTEIAKHLNLTEAEARRQWRHVELNSPDGGPGIQIELQDDSASLAVPYWHTPARAEEVFEEVWDYLALLQQGTGYSAFDPQLGRVLTLASDRTAVLAKYLEGVQFTQSMANRGTKKPWWKFW